MNAGALNVFHDAGDQRVDAVTNRVHFNFAPAQVFVDEDGVFLFGTKDNFHIFADIFGRKSDYHVLAAKHI